MSYLMPHYFNDEYTAVGSGCCMNPINRIGCNIHCTLKSKCHIRSPEIVVDRLRKCHNIQSLFTQQIGSLMRSISAQYHKTVQVQLVVCMLHRLYLIKPVLVRHTHQLKRLSGGSEDCTSSCQDS